MRTQRFFSLLAMLAVAAGAWAQNIYPDGYEPETCGFVEQQAMAKMEYAELRARMDAEDPRIARAFEAKELLGDSVSKIAEDLGVSEPRVYQLLKRAKEIGKQYQMVK